VRTILRSGDYIIYDSTYSRNVCETANHSAIDSKVNYDKLYKPANN